MPNMLWVIIVGTVIETISFVLKFRLMIIAWKREANETTDLDGYCFFSFPFTLIVEIVLIVLLIREIYLMCNGTW